VLREAYQLAVLQTVLTDLLPSVWRCRIRCQL